MNIDPQDRCMQFPAKYGGDPAIAISWALRYQPLETWQLRRVKPPIVSNAELTTNEQNGLGAPCASCRGPIITIPSRINEEIETAISERNNQSFSTK